jgi:6-phosphogluconolactonase (cycloisomerase 2 family)
VAPGTTAITASLGTITSTPVTLTVTPPTLRTIAVTPAAASIIIGKTQPFVATGTYSDGSTVVITTSVVWTSATNAVATINNTGSNGVASGTGLGTTSITAALSGITSNAAILTVTAGYAYAVNFSNAVQTTMPTASTVSQYTIGADGALTALTPATVAAGVNPFSITLDSTGHYAYVANYTFNSPQPNGTVSQYSVGTDGTLTALNPASVATGRGPNGVTAHPTEPYVYVADYNDGIILQFGITTTGQLAALTPASVGGVNGPTSIAVDPSGKYAYVAAGGAGAGGSRVYQYTVTAGLLTPMTSPFVAAGVGANYIVVDPLGRYAYVANVGPSNAPTGNTVSQYTISTDGSLTPMTPATATAGTGASSVTVDPTGRYAYVPNEGANTVSQFIIGPGGALAAMTPAFVAAGTGAHSIAIDSTGHFAYVANRHSTAISQFSIGATGGLTPLTAPTAPAGTNPVAIITAR